MDATILLVDDQPANLKLLWSFLDEHNFTLRVAESGELALKLLKKTAPDLILLDVMMPGIDGFETCRRIRSDERTKDLPIIFMTALNSVEDKVAGFAAGGHDYITKPFQQAEVLARVYTHILLRRRSLALEQALAEIKVLKGIIPVCSYCKKFRSDEGYWQQVEQYISEHTDAQVSHGICPACFENLITPARQAN